MAWPVVNLPMIQKWDCHNCGVCCKDYHVFITAEEKHRILQQGWDKDPHLTGTPVVVPAKRGGQSPDRLNQRSDGSCVFLYDSGKCRIHAKFVLTAKPLACQIYPFVLVPCGEHWRVSLRFACPSVTKNLGQNLTGHLPELRRFGRDIEEREGVSGRNTATAQLHRGQTI